MFNTREGRDNTVASGPIQPKVNYVLDDPPAEQTIDIFEQIMQGRILFGLTAGVLNGHVIGGPTDFLAHLNRPTIEQRQVVTEESPYWESRITALPTNHISFNIRIPVASRWRTNIPKTRINSLFEKFNEPARFANLEGNAELELLPQPSPGDYYIHIFRHEQNHAEDIVFRMGFWFEDWDHRLNRVKQTDWGHGFLVKEKSLEVLWRDVGRTPEELAQIIGEDMARDSDYFHGSTEGAAPAFNNAVVYEEGPRATIEVRAVHQLTF